MGLNVSWQLVRIISMLLNTCYTYVLLRQQWVRKADLWVEWPIELDLMVEPMEITLLADLTFTQGRRRRNSSGRWATGNKTLPVILEATDNGLRTDMTFTQRRRRRWRKKKKLQWSLSHWKQHCQLYWKQQTMDYGQIWHSHKEGEEDEGRRRNSSGRWATGNNIASYTGSNKQWTMDRYDIHTKKEKKMKEEEETPVVAEPLETTLPVILEATNNGLWTDMTFTQRRRRRWRKKKKLQWSLSHWKQHCQLYWKQQTMDYEQIWHSHKEGEEDEGRRRNSSGRWATGNNIASYTGSNKQWTMDRYDIHTKKEKKMKEEEETPVVAEPLETTFPVILEATNNGPRTDMTFTQWRRRRRRKKTFQWWLTY